MEFTHSGKLSESLMTMILFYSSSSIRFSNEPTNLHEINILFITYFPKRTLNCKRMITFHRQTCNVTLMFSVLLTLYLHSINGVKSKCYYTIVCYYTSVISFLLNGFITPLRRVIYIV